jgi:hypothetical protein
MRYGPAAGHRSGIGQMIIDVSRISLVCSFAIFQARNDHVWFSPRLVTRYIDEVPIGEWVRRPPGETPSPCPPLPPEKKKRVGCCYYCFWTVLTHCQLRRSGIELSLSLALLLFCIQLLLQSLPHPLVCRVDQCISPGPEFRDYPIPAGNCGPISSDLHVLDRHVRILYKFMFYT